MSKLKVLRSIAHNLAHSYLSLTNYIDGNYVVEYLLQAAKSSGEGLIIIDVLNMSIEPVVFQIPPLKKSQQYLKDTLERLLASDNLTFGDIVSVEIRIEFDLKAIRRSPYVPSIEYPQYSCISQIVDIKRKAHEASVVEWWRYG